MATTWTGGLSTAHNRGGTGVSPMAGTMKYGSLDETEAFKIQKKFLSIAKRSMIMARFAQKETKAQKEGLEVRWKRFEKFALPMVPLAEGVKPPADTLLQTIIKVKLNQYGSYVATTDVLVAAATDPIIQQVTERQSIQAAELMDFITFLHARSGTQAAYAGGTTRATVDEEIGGTTGDTTGSTTNLLDTAVRTLEYNEARKIAKQMTPSAKYNTEPVPEAYVAVGHTDLRKDIEKLPGFIPYVKYSNNGQQMLPGELGSVGVIRFVLTTQAAPFGRQPDGTEIKDTNISHTQGSYTPGYGSPVFGQTVTQASQTVSDSTNYGEAGTAEAEEIGAAISTLKLVTTVGTANVQVYPIVIFSAECIGCVSLSGYDAVIPKVVMPQPAVTDPLGQSGSVGWKSWYACQILNEDWLYRIECGASTIS
jgi:N4-gp56 family major capsid protein